MDMGNSSCMLHFQSRGYAEGHAVSAQEHMALLMNAMPVIGGGGILSHAGCSGLITTAAPLLFFILTRTRSFRQSEMVDGMSPWIHEPARRTAVASSDGGRHEPRRTKTLGVGVETQEARRVEVAEAADEGRIGGDAEPAPTGDGGADEAGGEREAEQDLSKHIVVFKHLGLGHSGCHG